MKFASFNFMKRVAVFVDAGYFFAQGSIALTGQKRLRGDANLEIKKLIKFLEEFAVALTKSELLRIYWYDGTAVGPTPQHIALAIEANVKLRLGFVNASGQQKGVDSLIVTDMINLARNHAMSDAVLLSGDEDLRVGVQQAQEFGVRVHLVGICSHPDNPQKNSQSQFLLQEADVTHMWTEKEMSKFLSYPTRPVFPKAENPIAMEKTESKHAPTNTKARVDPNAVLSALAKEAAADVEDQLIQGLLVNFASTKQIPPEIDRLILGKAKRLLGLLTADQKTQVRQAFIAFLKERPAKQDNTKK